MSYDLFDDGKADSGSSAATREKWLEYLGQLFGTEPLPAIADATMNPQRPARPDLLCLNHYDGARSRVLDGVLYNILKDLNYSSAIH